MKETTYYQRFKAKKTYRQILMFLLANVVLLSMSDLLFSQQSDLQIPPALYKKANTAQNASYLSDDEKKVILYMNIARIDGRWFIDNIIENYVFGETRNVKSLRKDLLKTSNLQVFKPSINLTKAATFHTKDLGKTGKLGHNSTDGTAPFVRIRRFAKGNAMSENCYYGYSDPIKIVLGLLIDERVPSLGHRRTILSSSYSYVGVSIEPHKSPYRYCCVQDFSDTNDE